MAGTFIFAVYKVLSRSDIVLEVLDARFVEETRNHRLEDKIHRTGKTLLYVINKADLVDKQRLCEQIKDLHPAIAISARERDGTKRLRDLIKRYATKDPTMIGVIGYPNTGKSSVINILCGRRAAKAASKAGTTRGYQTIKLTSTIYLVDTPGVIPYHDPYQEAILGGIDTNKVKEPDLIAERMLEEFPEISKHYDIDTLEEFAIKHKLLLKGARPDTQRAARMIINDWQKGKIKPEAKKN